MIVMSALFEMPLGPIGTWPPDLDRGGQSALAVEEPAVPAAVVQSDAPPAGPPCLPAGGALKVLGLDLSLTGTGLAGSGWADTIRFPARHKKDDPLDYAHRRLAHIRDTIADRYLTGVRLAVIEGLALNLHSTAMDRLAGLSWIIRQLLWQRGIPYALVSPTSLKLYAFGRGRRSAGDIAADDAEGRTVKSLTVAAVQSWYPWFDGDDNAADAAVLATMGLDFLGHPPIVVPEARRNALVGVRWPEVHCG